MKILYVLYVFGQIFRPVVGKHVGGIDLIKPGQRAVDLIEALVAYGADEPAEHFKEEYDEYYCKYEQSVLRHPDEVSENVSHPSASTTSPIFSPRQLPSHSGEFNLHFIIAS